MRRAEFLRLTALTVDNHKNLVRRDCIPFGGERDDGSTPAYDYRQAFGTKLMLRLSSHLELRHAKDMIEIYLDPFVAKFGPALKAGDQIFFGYGKHFGDNRSNVRVPDVGLVSGPLHDLTESLIVDDDAGHFSHFELVKLGTRKAPLTDVVLIDAGQEMVDFQRDLAGHPLATSWMSADEVDA